MIAIAAIGLKHAAKRGAFCCVTTEAAVFAQFRREVWIIAGIIRSEFILDIVFLGGITAQGFGVERLNPDCKLLVVHDANRFTDDVPDRRRIRSPQNQFDPFLGLHFQNLQDDMGFPGLDMDHRPGTSGSVVQGEPFGLRIPRRRLRGDEFTFHPQAQKG